MGQRQRGALEDAVRWLGAPPTVLALVVLTLNDHVWKQQWPGVVTGKLSDVAGLVLAPPLMAVVLAAGRVPRPRTWALVGTGLGFTLVKSTEAGAGLASAALSLVTPSQVLRDPTDLLALTGLLVAWWVSRGRDRTTRPRRRAASLAAGALVLPMAVLATAATGQCPGHDEVRRVTLVEGVFLGHTESTRAIVVDTTSGPSGLLDATGQVVALPGADEARLDNGSMLVDQTCSASTGSCWRIKDPQGLTVELSTDGGTSWQPDYAMPAGERDDIVDRIGQRCGEAARVETRDLAVLDGSTGPVVAVAFRSGGVLVRRPGGDWRRITVGGYGLPVTTPAPTSPSPTAGDGLIEPRGDDVPPVRPRRSPTGTATPCSSQATRVITPDPRNGPRTTQTYCRV